MKSDRLSPDEDRLREDNYYEALAFSRHTVNLELNEETMEAAEAPRNARIDPNSMKIKQWYKGHDRVSDKKSTGRIEDDDERVAMGQSNMPPPVPERVANPRIREDQAVQYLRQNSANTKALFDCCRSVFHSP